MQAHSERAAIYWREILGSKDRQATASRRASAKAPAKKAQSAKAAAPARTAKKAQRAGGSS
jgi:hypothetical protein